MLRSSVTIRPPVALMKRGFIVSFLSHADEGGVLQSVFHFELTEKKKKSRQRLTLSN